MAGPEDRVCVTPESRARAALDNTDAANNVDAAGTDGPNTCVKDPDGGRLVWREAFPGDVVCVTREIRQLVRAENRTAASRRACN